jgi:hypothetical protein
MIKKTLIDGKVAQTLTAQADELIAKLKQDEALENLAAGATVTAFVGVTRI